MDAYNLAVCVTPALIRSSDVVRDAQHCRIGGGKAKEPSTMTVGTLVRILIEQCPDMFDSEPSPSPSLTNGPSISDTTPPQSPQRPVRSRQSTESSTMRSPPKRSDIVRVDNGKATISRKGRVVAACESFEASGLFDAASL